jgi:hypothetical protein
MSIQQCQNRTAFTYNQKVDFLFIDRPNEMEPETSVTVIG